jgi:hypothetical protein
MYNRGMMIVTTNGEHKMLNDFDEVNGVLADLAEQGIVEPMVEPIDDPNLEINYWDWADIVGIVDELTPNEPFWANIY